MNPGSEEWLRAMGRDAYAETTGLEVLRAEPGLAEVRMPVTPAILNGHGIVHGGALFTLADYASAIAANLIAGPVVAANASISYLRPIRRGFALARAKTVKSGRRVKVQMVEIYDDRGDLAAIFQGGAMPAADPARPPAPA
ncbi:MAG: PaaI family thioesterase [Planctomycetota bacterium]|jgi:acyl-CoA thioesterase|nr:PaaI family thioesterase [Planctomycetota bacterium]